MSSRRRGPTRPPSPSSVYKRHRIPLLHVFLSLVFGSPIPRRWVFIVLGLVREQWRIGKPRAAERLSYLEGLVVSRAIAAAATKRDQAAGQLTGLVDKADETTAGLNALVADVARLDDHPVAGVRGELMTATAAATRMSTLASRSTQDAEAGSLLHRRVMPGLRKLAPFMVLLDFPVLLWFVGSVFNVDWSNLTGGQGIIPLITSATFALLGTVAVAVGLTYIGHDLKGYKDRERHVRVPRGQASSLPLVFLAFSVLVALGAGATMAYRVVSDSVAAGSGWWAAAILGLFFAVIVVMLQVVVWSVHYRDGSLLTDEMDHLRAQLAPIERQRTTLERQKDRVGSQLKALRSKGESIRSRLRGETNTPVVGAHQVVMCARSYHQGCNWSTELITPEDDLLGLIAPLVRIDLSVMDELIERLHAATDVTSEPDHDSEREEIAESDPPHLAVATP